MWWRFFISREKKEDKRKQSGLVVRVVLWDWATAQVCVPRLPPCRSIHSFVSCQQGSTNASLAHFANIRSIRTSLSETFRLMSRKADDKRERETRLCIAESLPAPACTWHNCLFFLTPFIGPSSSCCVLRSSIRVVAPSTGIYPLQSITIERAFFSQR